MVSSRPGCGLQWSQLCGMFRKIQQLTGKLKQATMGRKGVIFEIKKKNTESLHFMILLWIVFKPQKYLTGL